MLILFLLLFPLLGAALLGAWRGANPRVAGWMSVLWSAVPILALKAAALGYDPGVPLAQWHLAWMPMAGMDLRFEADGLSLVFLMLTAFVTPFALAVAARVGNGGRAFGALALILQAMLFGVFTARHFIPWFLCWELTLIPAWLLIRLWGGPGAPKAGARFFIVTLAGSIAMLIGFLAIQLVAGTMDFDALADMAKDGQLAEAFSESPGGSMALLWVAAGIFLGLAVKVPLVPLHAWLPGAYAEAPSPVTMLLTGLLSKMGVYGFLRIMLPVFPDFLHDRAPWLGGLALVTIVYGALAALAATDLKRILAYSSVNHLGYCMLALFTAAVPGAGESAISAAISGAVLQAFNHGVIASTLFAGVAFLEARSGGLRNLNDFGGIRSRTPVLCGLMGIALFASLGLPGLAGFPGEFLIFLGVFGIRPVFAAIAALGLLFTAVFVVRLVKQVFNGPLTPAHAAIRDLDNGERAILAPAVLVIIAIGVLPQIVLHWSNPWTVWITDFLQLIP